MNIKDQVQKALRELQAIPGISVMVCTAGDLKPDYLRYPRPGTRCPFTGLSLSGMRRMIQDSKGKVTVKSANEEEGGHAVKLIHRGSLIAYIDTLPSVSYSD